MAMYDTGYEDERFQHPVGHTLHCGVCMNVLKDPVMCQQNEHLYCRACITPRLKNSQTCPSCMEPLTVETLRQASRGIRSLLAELKIRCEFYDRGCGEFIELENLESHLRDCGFAPAVCSNEGCRLEVNQRDLLHHETVVCELRRIQCHSCSEIKQEMEAMKVRLAAMDEKLEKNVKQLPERLDRLERSGKMVEANLIAKIEQVQEQINMQEEKIKVEIKTSLNVIAKQLETIVQTLPEVQAEQKKKGVAEASVIGREPKDIAVRGQNVSEISKLSNATLLGTEVSIAFSMIPQDRRTFHTQYNNIELFVTSFV